MTEIEKETDMEIQQNLANDVKSKLINSLKSEQQSQVEQIAKYKALSNSLSSEIQQRARIIEILEKTN